MAVAQTANTAEKAERQGFRFQQAVDRLIFEEAKRQGVDPVILKAIVAKESSFNPEAINPEKTFALQGVTYSPVNPQGRRALRRAILAENLNPLSIRVNPSIGLAQVRLTIARAFLPDVTARELFDPRTNLRASASLLRQLFDNGITLDTIDAYNVGQDLQPRNLPYRDAVKQFAREFQNDFPR